MVKINRENELRKYRDSLNEFKNHYGDVVKTNEESSLYIRKNNDYKKIGTVSENVFFELDDINLDTKYFKIKDTDYYLYYDSVLPSELIKNDNRYKNYIPFNENIITNNFFSLYDGEKVIYQFFESMSFPIIIKDYNESYYVEYNNMLLRIKKEDVMEIVESNNTEKTNQGKITTLAYHRIFKDESCNDSYTCMKQENFDKEMKYLKDNNYFTLTMEEMYLYLTGKLQIEKGILLTFDDGLLMTNAIEILEKYQLFGTAFVVTSIFYDFNYFKSDYLYVQSHTDNLHRNYVCPGGYQGGAMLCASYDEIKKDLETSIEKIGNAPFAFAFPFYDYNEKAISVLKDLKFKMSFIGRSNTMGKSIPNKTDLYKIPRMTVWDLNIMSFETWKSYL